VHTNIQSLNLAPYDFYSILAIFLAFILLVCRVWPNILNSYYVYLVWPRHRDFRQWKWWWLSFSAIPCVYGTGNLCYRKQNRAIPQWKSS